MVVGVMQKMPFKHLAMQPGQEGMSVFAAKNFRGNADMNPFAAAHEVIEYGWVKTNVSTGQIRDKRACRDHCEKRRFFAVDVQPQVAVTNWLRFPLLGFVSEA